LNEGRQSVTRKKDRIDTSGPRESLGHNPFAALSGDKAPQPAAAPVAQPTAPSPLRTAFRVAKTRKGGWPLSLEKRSGGKVVTILKQVEGDTHALLKTLRKLCGAGGVVRDDSLEIQGDHQDAIRQWLEKDLDQQKT